MLDSDKARFLAILPTLTLTQLRYVIERPRHTSNADAARAIKISVNTPSRWPNRDVVEEAVRLVVMDDLFISQAILRRNLPRAAQVKVAALASADERIQQAAATELLDRFHGKPTQRNELSGAVTITDDLSDDERIARLVAIFDAARARSGDPAFGADQCLAPDSPA